MSYREDTNLPAFSDFETFGFGEGDDKVSQKKPYFKGREGEKYRVSLAWWERNKDGTLNLDSSSPKFTGVMRVYIPGCWYVKASSEEVAAFAEKPPKLAIGLIVVKWPTDRNGMLDKERFARGDYEVMYWVISKDKYDAIKPIHSEWHLGSTDLLVTCSDSQFQKMTFSPTRKNLLRDLSESEKGKKLYKKICEDIAFLEEDIEGALANSYSADEVRRRVSGGGAGGGGGTKPLADAASDEDVEEFLDDILE